MDKLLIEACVSALEDDAKHMSEDKRMAFIALLPMLSKIYRDDAKVRGVMVLCDEEGQTIVRMNANEFEAQGMLHGAIPFHEELMKAEAPDHRRMN
jgi:hypothetical protein